MKAQNKKLLIGLAALVVLAAVMVGCWLAFGPKAADAGQKEITFAVIYADQTRDDFTISTDAEFLRGALEQEGLITGEESEYGLFVTAVNGVAADDANQEWWCFTRGGETLMTGVDSTPIADGDQFEATLTVGY